MSKIIAAALQGEIIAGIVIGVIVIAAIVYIVIAKKKGKKCIGCPGGCSCNMEGDDAPSCDGGCASCGGSCCFGKDKE
ncbi:MAG: hypothetical protein IKC48_00255 [Clostridia bacterium]|nr:hypothetical protein [Clostridia bacterium]